MRVAITGIGLVTPLGTGVEAYWQAALRGESGVRTVHGFPSDDLTTRFGGDVPDFDPGRWLDRKAMRTTDRFAQFAVAAAGLALEDAGLTVGGSGGSLGAVDPTRIGAVLGTGIGGIEEIWNQTERLVLRGPSRVSPFFVPKMMPNGGAGNVAIRFGLEGPNFATASACASALHAIGVASWMIKSGAVDAVLCGGTEAPLNRLGMAAFCAARALSKRNDEPARASRPFDRGRDGFVMGEGGGVFVLEPLERARARGARIYAELVGYGATDDAHHMTAPEPEGRGASRAMVAALCGAGVAPDAVGYVSAHGTSTPLGDKAETLALKRAFGDHAARLMVGSTKSQTGHLLGAAGSISLAAAILAVFRHQLIPTINLEESDPDCDLDYVPLEAREAPVEVALANAFGFGGHNASVVVRRVT